MDEVVQEFIQESIELLDALERDLVELESEPENREIIDRVFRVMHTIKGNSGILGFANLERASHSGENLLSVIRDGKMLLESNITSAILCLADRISEEITQIEKTGKESGGAHEDVIGLMESFLLPSPKEKAPTKSAAKSKKKKKTKKKAKSKKAAKSKKEDKSSVDEDFLEDNSSSEDELFSISEDDADTSTDDPKSKDKLPSRPQPIGEILLNNNLATQDEIKRGLEVQKSGDKRKLGEILSEDHIINPHSISEALEIQAQKGTTEIIESSIHVRVDVLDSIINMVGELVLARNQVLELIKVDSSPQAKRALQALNGVTSKLQEEVMRTRMQPVSRVWSKLPRLVRDLSLQCEKRVNLQTEGDETEIDKTVLDAIRDPLTHMVRNSIDHGLETPQDRVLAGKPPEGTLTLRAYHRSGRVTIEVADDGKGVDIEKVRARAVSGGLVSADIAAKLGDNDVADLIFLSGFSTADEVTNLSGRGVGMDVVKTNIERVGGTVEILTERERGTTFRVSIPLTLTIVPALIVSIKGHHYAIPQVNVSELNMPEQGGHQIEDMHGTPVCRLREQLLPVIDGRSIFGHKSSIAHQRTSTLVIMNAEDSTYALAVDAVIDYQEIVVKPIDVRIQKISIYAGATIMGDGRIALILDAVGLAEHSGLLSDNQERVRFDSNTATSRVVTRPMVLFVETETDGRMIIPLKNVERLHLVAAERIEHVGDRDVVQIRGEMLYLVHLGTVLEERRKRVREESKSFIDHKVNIVVCTNEGGAEVGIVVRRIVDIIELDGAIEREAARAGVVGTTLMRGRIAELLDVDWLLDKVGAKSTWS